MSRLILAEGAAPSAPAATKKSIYFDSADGRLKYIDANGLVRTLTSVEWPKNQLINGGFNFAQRQVPGTLTTYSQTASRAYTADRWFACNENASLQFQQIDTITAPEGVAAFQHRYYGRYKKITAGGKFLVGQVMSAENMAVLRGKRVRVQCWMKRTIAAAMTVRLGLAQFTAAGTHDVVPGWVAGAPSGTFVSAWGASSTDPTLGTNVSRLTPVALTADGGTIVGAGLNCDLTGAMARYSVCFDVPTDAKNLIWMVWTNGQPAANDELNIGQALLTEGVEIVEWISLPQIHELSRCQRFYCKTFAAATAPATSVGINTGEHKTKKVVAAATAGRFEPLVWPVIMRATPTLTLYNPAAANAQARDETNTVDTTATAAVGVTDRQAAFTFTGNAATVAEGLIGLHVAADAEL